MQIKTIMRYHLSHLWEWLSSIHHWCIDDSHAGKGVENGNTSGLLVGMSISAAIVENSIEFTPKMKNGTASWSLILLLRIYLKKPQNTNSKEYMHPYVY